MLTTSAVRGLRSAGVSAVIGLLNGGVLLGAQVTTGTLQSFLSGFANAAPFVLPVALSIGFAIWELSKLPASERHTHAVATVISKNLLVGIAATGAAKAGFMVGTVVGAVVPLPFGSLIFGCIFASCFAIIAIPLTALASERFLRLVFRRHYACAFFCIPFDENDAQDGKVKRHVEKLAMEYARIGQTAAVHTEYQMQYRALAREHYDALQCRDSRFKGCSSVHVMFPPRKVPDHAPKK